MEPGGNRALYKKKEVPFPDLGEYLCATLHGNSMAAVEASQDEVV